MPTDEEIEVILRGDSEKMISLAESFAKVNLGRASTASIRKVYSEVKSMKEYDKYKLDLLRAKLAYVSHRHKDLSPLTELLDKTIKKVKKESFRYFQDFFQAILAYFYKYGKTT
ncbi:MAG: type III-A CRISPR-associated protein Csm2 [Thermodesulfovibrionales bacterium]|nr:type III-A CRISPR-associated protein Csm2 [Thermodesulfovibrionales bacterium]